MSNYNDMSGGVRIATMVDAVKNGNFKNIAEMIDLGSNDNLAFTYPDGMLCYCKAERRTFRWQEATLNNGVPGERPTAFTYPANLTVDGINYSNRSFNFFEILSGRKKPIPYLDLELKAKGIDNTDPTKAYDLEIGDIVEGFKDETIYWTSARYDGPVPGPRENYTPLEEVIIGDENPPFPSDGEDGMSAYEIAVEHGFVGTEEEWLESLHGEDGADGAPGISAYQVAVNNGYLGSESDWLLSLKGTNGTNGTNGKSAYQVALDNGFIGTEAQWLNSLKGANGANASNNFQRTITASIVLADTDNNFVIWINNGASNISITVPNTGLREKFNCGFYQMGTGEVSFIGASGPPAVTLITTFGFKLKGQGYQAYIERNENTQVYGLMGNTKA